MQKETITRLRNSFALVALELLEERVSSAVVAEHALPFSSMTAADWREAVRLWRQHAKALLATAPDRPCPACGSERSRWLFESYDEHPFHECEQCGCWFEPKRVDSAVFERLFARSPEARTLASHMMSARDRAELRDADMARVGGYLDDLLPLLPRRDGQPLAYLDTGCGVGHSLRAGRARGLTVQGVEVDRTAIELARADGLPVASLDDPLPAGPYQLLSFWETLEHIAAPLETLNRFVPYLAEDGLVAITVPNLNALATRTLREACAWVHGGYNTPGHVNLFHPLALERLLSRAGLTLLEADGQFSGNPVELVAYLRGATRGAFDTLDPSLARGTLSASVEESLKAMWPGVALVERLALASPILQVMACRQGREATFAPAIAERRAARRQQIEEEARALLAGEPDYKAMAETLRQEIDRREIASNETLAQQQQEINLRDDLLQTTQQITNDLQGRLAEAQQQINLRDDLLQGRLAEAQQQINLRDDLLIAAQKKLDETIDARLLNTLRVVRKALKS